jgi:hypothetical protein
MSSDVEAIDATAAAEALYRDGIVGRQGAFSRRWAEELSEDLALLFNEALRRPNGALGRGPRRYYVEIHPERLRGFEAILTNPWLTAVSEAVLGPDYEFVEVGFDVPLPGAFDQPWHRDFVAPPEALAERRITSLAFNMTTVDVAEDMGPFEIAPGTHWESGTDFEHGMFPPKSEAARYEQLAERKFPRMGDASARSALAIHRGTAHRSWRARPVLIVGVVAAGAGGGDQHNLELTRRCYEALDEGVRAHLPARLVDELVPLEQAHTIEGLVMGEP